MAIKSVKCPSCGGAMTSRKNARDGSRFWGCLSYQACRGTRNVDGEAPRSRDESDDDGDDRGLPSSRQRDNDRRRWQE